MSIDVKIVGTSTKDLEDLVRGLGMRAGSTSSIGLLKPDHTGAGPADVVVLDLRGQASVPSALAQLRKDHPSIGIVIVAASPEPSLMLEAMRAGVSEYVTEPVTRPDLAAAIARVAADGKAPAACEVLAMVGVKGGVGVTTLAVNVATALARKAPGSVLLIDLNPACGDAAVLLGADPRFSMLDALHNATRLDETYLKGLIAKTTAGPDLLASPDRVIAVEADAQRVRTVVEAASRCYRYVVLDVPRWGSSIGSALEMTSSITVVTTQDVAALRNGHRLTTFLRERYGASRVRVVANRFDRSAEIGEDDLERALGGPVCGRFPSADRLVVDALNRGLPIVLDNQTKLAGEFRDYARLLVAGTESKSRSNRSPRLFGILGGRRRHPPTK